MASSVRSPEPDWKNKLLVVGIDVGTTHSGYVWNFLTDYQKDKTAVQNKTWKGERSSGKTPTCLLLKVQVTVIEIFFYQRHKPPSVIKNNENNFCIPLIWMHALNSLVATSSLPMASKHVVFFIRFELNQIVFFARRITELCVHCLQDTYIDYTA